MRYLKFLDGLRCLSIVWVVLLHLPLDLHGLPGLVSSRGWMGVDMFFVISGFLITSILLAEREKKGRISLRNFYLRRACRIWPIYYIVIGMYVILALVALRWGFNPLGINAQRTLSTIVWPATYLSNVFVSQTGSERIVMLHSWSLAMEEQFYLLWPMALVIGTLASFRIAMTTVISCTLWRFWLVFHYAQGVPAMTRLFYGPDTRIDVILYGCILALLLANQANRDRLTRIYKSPLFVPAITITFAIVCYETNRWSGWFGNSLGYGLSAVIMASMLGYVVCVRPAKLIALLEWGPVAYIGKISYGIYLYHLLVIDGAQRFMGKPQSFGAKSLFVLVACAASVAVAAVSYRLIEQPILKLKERFN